MDITGKLPVQSSSEPLGFALLAAFAFHAVLLLAVGFGIDSEKPQKSETTLDITLVANPKKQDKTDNPDLFAQSNQLGGGEKANKQRPSSPLGSLHSERKNKPAPELQRSGAKQPDAIKKAQVLVQKKSPIKQVVSKVTPDIKAAPKPKMAQLLASTQQEIDRLTAEIDRRHIASSNQPKRKVINASTQEYKYAAYMDAWRKKVISIGNLNYPDEAKRKRLYGALLLHLAVKSNGTIESVRILRSSGHKILDDAAVRIVRLAAPYAPFPKNIRKEVDVLDITRTWQFTSSNRLFTGR